MNSLESRCPVCYMKVVGGDDISLTYQGMHFVFCSEQCRERFVSNPHVYIGRAGHPSPKQQGKESVKCRRMHLKHPLTPEQAAVFVKELSAMMGVKVVDVEGSVITVQYDLLQATCEQLENRIEQVGNHLADGLGESLRRAFIHYLEETELENLEIQTSGRSRHHH